MRDGIKRELREIDPALTGRLHAVLRILAKEKPTLCNLKAGVGHHLLEFSHPILPDMWPPLVIRIVIARRSQSIVV